MNGSRFPLKRYPRSLPLVRRIESLKRMGSEELGGAREMGVFGNVFTLYSCMT